MEQETNGVSEKRYDVRCVKLKFSEQGDFLYEILKEVVETGFKIVEDHLQERGRAPDWKLERIFQEFIPNFPEGIKFIKNYYMLDWNNVSRYFSGYLESDIVPKFPYMKSVKQKINLVRLHKKRVLSKIDQRPIVWQNEPRKGVDDYFCRYIPLENQNVKVSSGFWYEGDESVEKSRGLVLEVDMPPGWEWDFYISHPFGNSVRRLELFRENGVYYLRG